MQTSFVWLDWIAKIKRVNAEHPQYQAVRSGSAARQSARLFGSYRLFRMYLSNSLAYTLNHAIDSVLTEVAPVS